MPQLGFCKGSPHRGPQGQSIEAHLGTLAWGLSAAFGALCMHPGLLSRCEGNLTFPAIACHISPDGRDQGLQHFFARGPFRSNGSWAAPSGAQALTKVEVMILALPKRTASQFTKMETEKKKPKKKKKKK